MLPQLQEQFDKAPTKNICDYIELIGDGLVLEFGVASGSTINLIAVKTPRTVYGFDWFKGLPETWRPGIEQGAFACDVPIVADNVVLINGLFEDTVAPFIAEHNEPVAFIHIDCDLYSSTKTVLNALKPNIVNGTIIVFDEIFNYPGYEMHEYKAFLEFLDETNYKYECIGREGTEKAGFRLYR